MNLKKVSKSQLTRAFEIKGIPNIFFLFFVALCALNQLKMQIGNCGSSCACMGVIVMRVHEEDRQYERLMLTYLARMLTYLARVGTSPREGSGDRHHAITYPDEMIRHE